MPTWLGTTIVAAVLVVIIGLIVFFRIKARRAGKTGCGCGCESCAMDCRNRTRPYQKQ